MVKMPAAKEDVVNDALPPLSVTVPRTADPFLKVMVSPLGGAPALELTAAVKVTACHTSEGLSEDVMEVDVAVTPSVSLIRTPTEPTPFVPPFTTNRSGLPSPLTSAVAKEIANSPPE